MQTFQKGENVKLKWTYTSRRAVSYRAWYFTSSDGKFHEKLLARIFNDGNIKYEFPELDIEIVKPATLILKNVNSAYNGTYEFSIPPSAPVAVSVFIAGIYLIIIKNIR